MSPSSRVCPKCGYQRRSEDQAPDHECPRCGVIYDKIVSAQSRQAVPAESSRKAAAPKDGKGQWPMWVKATVPVLVVVIAATVWAVMMRPGKDSSAQAPGAPVGLDSPGVSFDYVLEGTWEGRLQEEYPARGTMMPYTADYEAMVLVDAGREVREVRWTDSHSSLSRVTVIWKEGDVELVGEERPGGTPEKMREPMEEYLRLVRSGSGMDVSYHRPLNLELKFNDPEAFPQNPQGADQGLQLQAGPDSLTLAIPVRLLQEKSWSVPSSRISRFVLSPEGAREFWYLKPPGAQGGSGDAESASEEYVTGCTLPRRGIFSGGSAGVNMECTLEKVSVLRVTDENLKSVDPESIIRLDDDTVMNLRANKFERQLQLRFTKAGKVTLEVKDRRLQPSGQPLIYNLEKIE